MVIMLHSDHGLHMHGVYHELKAEQFFIEQPLPSFFVLFDRSIIEESDYLNLIDNQQKLMSPFEARNFLLHLINEDND